MKCSLCKKEVETTFLGKIKGTYMNINGEKKIICSECQKKHKNNLRQIFK